VESSGSKGDKTRFGQGSEWWDEETKKIKMYWIKKARKKYLAVTFQASRNVHRKDLSVSQKHYVVEGTAGAEREHSGVVESLFYGGVMP